MSSRRFVAVPYMPYYNDLMGFTAEQLRLEGNSHIDIPGGVRHLGSKGNDACFSRGRPTIQETMVSVIRIERRRG